VGGRRLIDERRRPPLPSSLFRLPPSLFPLLSKQFLQELNKINKMPLTTHFIYVFLDAG